MEMKIVKKNTYTSILPVGKICDLADYKELESTIDDLVSAVNTIVIDLSRTTFITSQALGLFVSIFNKLQESSKKLILFNPRIDIKKTIEVIGINLVIDTVYTKDELEDLLSPKE